MNIAAPVARTRRPLGGVVVAFPTGKAQHGRRRSRSRLLDQTRPALQRLPRPDSPGPARARPSPDPAAGRDRPQRQLRDRRRSWQRDALGRLRASLGRDGRNAHARASPARRSAAARRARAPDLDRFAGARRRHPAPTNAPNGRPRAASRAGSRSLLDRRNRRVATEPVVTCGRSSVARSVARGHRADASATSPRFSSR